MRWRRYLRPLRPNLRADVDDEFRFHVEMLLNDLVANGWSPAAARAEAERRFGAIDPVRDACLTIDRRRTRRVAFGDRMGALVQDARYALRSIRLSVRLSAAVALTLALGIGAATTMYSLVNGVLLRPLPYPAAERLVALHANNGADSSRFPASFPEFTEWRKRSGDLFEEVGAWFPSGPSLVDGDIAETLSAQRMTASMPRILGVKPVMGRFFSEAEEAPDAERVVVLGEDFWRARFAADPHILGRTLMLSGQKTTVIGIYPSSVAARVPSDFSNGRATQVWQPLRLDSKSAPVDLHFLYVVARPKAEISLAGVSSGIGTVARTLIAEHFTTNAISVVPLADDTVGSSRRPLTLLLGAVGLLLLIACTNVANLLLARAASRRREFAVRLALGAGRGRLASQLLVESVIRSGLGGILGVAFAFVTAWWLRTHLVGRVPRIELVAINASVLLFALAVSVATGLLFGVAPAVRAARGDVGEVLRGGGRGVAGSFSRDRVRRSLVVCEVALSFVLLVQAGLLIRSLKNVLAAPLGFDATHMVSASFSLPAASYPDSVRQWAFHAALLARVSGLPGVKAAALASSLPIEGGTNGGVQIEGRTFPPSAPPHAEKRIVSTNYFETLGARAADGRLFDPSDNVAAPRVVIVNQSFARRWFPNERAVGKRIDFAWETKPYQTIAGVVADVREGSLAEAAIPTVYVPLEQRPSSAMYLIVRTAGNPADYAAAIRGAVHDIDARIPLNAIRTFDDLVDADTAGQRTTTSILVTFAALALVLAALGLYSVISYIVAQRTQELGIRTALGAQRRDILRLVLGQGARLAGGGLLIGVVGALLASRLIASQLFGVATTDVPTFAIVAVTLGAIAFGATVVPAWRAAAVSPLEALRPD